MRLTRAAKKKVVRAGVPGKDGLSAYESMVAADDNFTTPDQDFGRTFGNPTRELLDEQLAEGQRQQAEKRRQIAEKKRLVEVREKAKKAREAADKALKQ